MSTKDNNDGHQVCLGRDEIECRTNKEAQVALARGKVPVLVGGLYLSVSGDDKVVCLVGSPHVVVVGSSKACVEVRGSASPYVEALDASQPRVDAWGESRPHVEQRAE